MDDVAAKHSGFQFGHTDALALPHITHARDYVITPDSGDLLTEHLFSSIGEIGVCAYDGSFGYNNARAGVLKSGIHAYKLSLTEALAVDLGLDGHTAVRNEHAGQILLLCTSSWRLRKEE